MSQQVSKKEPTGIKKRAIWYLPFQYKNLVESFKTGDEVSVAILIDERY